MNTDNIIFAARLTPYRSLKREGFKLLMGFIGGVCLIIGLFFFSLGLWPIIGFMGLDFMLIYWAFKSNYRAAKAYEDVEVSHHRVLVQKICAKGKKTIHEFPQYGTRFEVDRHEEIGITKMWLSNRKCKVEFGYFLNPADRESFALVFKRAMASAKK